MIVLVALISRPTRTRPLRCGSGEIEPSCTRCRDHCLYSGTNSFYMCQVRRHFCSVHVEFLYVLLRLWCPLRLQPGVHCPWPVRSAPPPNVTVQGVLPSEAKLAEYEARILKTHRQIIGLGWLPSSRWRPGAVHKYWHPILLHTST